MKTKIVLNKTGQAQIGSEYLITDSIVIREDKLCYMRGLYPILIPVSWTEAAFPIEEEKNNYQRVQNMNLNELADFIDKCIQYEDVIGYEKKDIKNWLLKEKTGRC